MEIRAGRAWVELRRDREDAADREGIAAEALADAIGQSVQKAETMVARMSESQIDAICYASVCSPQMRRALVSAVWKLWLQGVGER